MRSGTTPSNLAGVLGATTTGALSTHSTAFHSCRRWSSPASSAWSARSPIWQSSDGWSHFRRVVLLRWVCAGCGRIKSCGSPATRPRTLRRSRFRTLFSCASQAALLRRREEWRVMHTGLAPVAVAPAVAPSAIPSRMDHHGSSDSRHIRLPDRLERRVRRSVSSGTCAAQRKRLDGGQDRPRRRPRGREGGTELPPRAAQDGCRG